MKLIEWINGVTKLSKATMDTFQTNIKTAFDNILNGTSNIKYDNTVSGLESQTVKEAIDELAEGTNASASDVTYDNETSGLTSKNVQGAIDELAKRESGSIITTQAFSKSVVAKQYTGTIVSMGTLSTPSGYTFVGFLPKTISDSGSAIAFNVYAQGTTVYANVTNGGAETTVTVTATALFIKS